MLKCKCAYALQNVVKLWVVIDLPRLLKKSVTMLCYVQVCAWTLALILFDPEFSDWTQISHMQAPKFFAKSDNDVEVNKVLLKLVSTLLLVQEGWKYSGSYNVFKKKHWCPSYVLLKITTIDAFITNPIRVEFILLRCNQRQDLGRAWGCTS